MIQDLEHKGGASVGLGVKEISLEEGQSRQDQKMTRVDAAVWYLDILEDQDQFFTQQQGCFSMAFS